MNISHKYKTCYIHIPKTGGSTIEYILFGRNCSSEHRIVDHYKKYYHYFIFSIVINFSSIFFLNHYI